MAFSGSGKVVFILLNPSGMTKLKAAIPILLVSEVLPVTQFYIDSLGFELEFNHHLNGEQDMPVVFASIMRGETLLYLRASEEPQRSAVYIFCSDVDELAKEFKAKGVNITYGPIDQGYGIKEMRIKDPWNNELIFAQPEA